MTTLSISLPRGLVTSEASAVAVHGHRKRRRSWVRRLRNNVVVGHVIELVRTVALVLVTAMPASWVTFLTLQLGKAGERGAAIALGLAGLAAIGWLVIEYGRLARAALR